MLTIQPLDLPLRPQIRRVCVGDWSPKIQSLTHAGIYSEYFRIDSLKHASVSLITSFVPSSCDLMRFATFMNRSSEEISEEIPICALLRIFAYFCGKFAYFRGKTVGIFVEIKAVLELPGHISCAKYSASYLFKQIQQKSSLFQRL